MCKWVPSEGETVFEVIEPLPSKKDPNAPRTIRDMLEADSERMAPLVLSTLLAGGEPAKQLVPTAYGTCSYFVFFRCRHGQQVPNAVRMEARSESWTKRILLSTTSHIPSVSRVKAIHRRGRARTRRVAYAVAMAMAAHTSRGSKSFKL